MFDEDFSSKLLAKAVNEFAKLPGIGKKTALRLVLHLLNQDEEQVNIFAESIVKLKKEIKICNVCNNLSDRDLCDICANPKRDSSLVCIVENIKDIIAIEKTLQFNGLVFALNTTMEGETTSFYLYKKLKNLDVEVSSIARGVGFGDELEYTDELTLGRAIANRTKLDF